MSCLHVHKLHVIAPLHVAGYPPFNEKILSIIARHQNSATTLTRHKPDYKGTRRRQIALNLGICAKDWRLLCRLSMKKAAGIHCASTGLINMLSHTDVVVGWGHQQCLAMIARLRSLETGIC